MLQELKSVSKTPAPLNLNNLIILEFTVTDNIRRMNRKELF